MLLNNLEDNCVCTECSKPVKSLIKTYKDGFIDLIQCVNYCLLSGDALLSSLLIFVGIV